MIFWCFRGFRALRVSRALGFLWVFTKLFFLLGGGGGVRGLGFIMLKGLGLGFGYMFFFFFLRFVGLGFEGFRV